MSDTEQAPGATAAAFKTGNDHNTGRSLWKLESNGFWMPSGADHVALSLGEHACYEPDRVVVRPHDTLPYTWVAEAFKGDALLARKSADSPREAAALLAKLIR